MKQIKIYYNQEFPVLHTYELTLNTKSIAYYKILYFKRAEDNSLLSLNIYRYKYEDFQIFECYLIESKFSFIKQYPFR